MSLLKPASLVAMTMIASSGAAQPASVKPMSTKACPARLAPDMPGFDRDGPPLIERFDLSYSARADGNVEVDLASKTSGGELLFIGSEHVSTPDPALFDYLESAVRRVKPSAVFVEVDDVSYLSNLPTDKERVIKTRGEPSYLGFIARQANIPVLPLEPPRGELLKRLRRQFSADDVALAFVLREVQIMRDRRHLYGEALEVQAARVLLEQEKLAKQANRPLAIRNILQLTQAVNRRWSGLDWRQVPAEWFNPFLSSSKTGSIFINALVAEEMAIRDRHALTLLLGQVALGKRVIALAGRSHAQTQLQALNCLMKGR